MIQSKTDMTIFESFEEANHAILKYLHQRLGFALWMVTRTEGDDWIILQVEDHGYAVEEGTVLRWADSFCSQMIQGRGPRIAPCSQNIPAYLEAPINKQMPISAYVGVPIVRKDGSLFGTLCAIDPIPHNESLQSELPLVELFAKLIGTQLEADLAAIQQERLLVLSEKEAMTDGLTGLLNRSGWDKHMTLEEDRARSYGSPACVLFIDLDDLKRINDEGGHEQGDSLIRHAAHVIRGAIRKSDIVARVGGDEFAVIGIDCNAAASDVLCDKVIQSLALNGINASVGKALRDHKAGLKEAMAEADQAMYAVKAERKKLNPSRL